MARVFQTTVGQIIAKARRIINDANSAFAYRNSDADAIGCLNDAMNALLAIRPGIFVKTGSHMCEAGYTQNLSNDRAVEFVEVLDGLECDRATLTQFKPAWRMSTTGAIVNWMRAPGEPLRFDVYPPAVASVALTIRYVASPVPFSTLTDIVQLSENYDQALVEYVAGRIEMQDDEHVNTGRAAQLMARFAEQVKGVA